MFAGIRSNPHATRASPHLLADFRQLVLTGLTLVVTRGGGAGLADVAIARRLRSGEVDAAAADNADEERTLSQARAPI